MNSRGDPHNMPRGSNILLLSLCEARDRSGIMRASVVFRELFQLYDLPYLYLHYNTLI